ncbi:MAG: nucleotidyltransferase domain-containing protein [Alphaproteobacteria bacterium]|nr:nucleotidyltransferase domain-containing protein [Alphaproteobacteria bacterium]
MSPDEYLYSLLGTEAVDTGPNSPALQAQAFLMPAVREWAGNQLASVQPSGSFAKGTANRRGTDIDLLISLKPTVSETLKEIYWKLDDRFIELGYKPRHQNVSLRIKVEGVDVDLVPGKQQEDGGTDHSLYRRRADTWTKTNVATHIKTVKEAGRQGETRLLKIWRDTQGLEFPSFHLELAVIAAIGYARLAPQGAVGTWTGNMTAIFRYLRDSFENARIVDPANTNNIISEDLTKAEKAKIRAAAIEALAATHWSDVLR